MSQRMRRVNESVKEVLAEAVLQLKDPRIGFLTVTDVRTSSDLKHAEVFYTVLPDDQESLTATAEGLESAQPLLRRELGARLRIRYVPDLRFSHDPVPAQGRRIDRLLREIPSPGDGDQDASPQDPGGRGSS
ncbi:MAG: 30S ribosome-binding factor RbfA [Nitriliruptorales bacterium]|nr:30S ribosome-binding factor RbfA [Nitriliruptorales bacterium]